ncbi:hypothetical protein [Actinophytocola xinjiangensis]|uniref:hypothetical protein n=1 Tax=Actinophytocola xinjiangensis TaxID=485602 RepID=UPI000A903AC1|nr:hypothetical protein [Actinophytocola xinjiangensis]
MRRALLVGGAQVLAVVPASVLMVAAWDRLPEELATRFAFDGSVSDRMSRPVMLVAMLGLGLVLALALGILNSPLWGVRVSTWDMPRVHVAFSLALAGFLGVILFGVVASNLDGQATSISLTYLLSAVGAAVVLGGLAALLVRASATAPPAEQGPVMPIAAGEQVSWSRPVSAPWMTGLGLVLLVAGPLVGWGFGWVAGGSVILAGVAVALLSRASVIVDRRGVTVTFTALRWPRKVIGLAEIETASAETVAPSEFGGWGYRIVPGASGLVLRRGAALVLTRPSGRRFVVTVDDAQTAASVVNGLRAR